MLHDGFTDYKEMMNLEQVVSVSEWPGNYYEDFSDSNLTFIMNGLDFEEKKAMTNSTLMLQNLTHRGNDADLFSDFDYITLLEKYTDALSPETKGTHQIGHVAFTFNNWQFELLEEVTVSNTKHSGYMYFINTILIICLLQIIVGERFVKAAYECKDYADIINYEQQMEYILKAK